VLVGWWLNGRTAERLLVSQQCREAAARVLDRLVERDHLLYILKSD
jgi:hypothetical protein